MTVHAKKIVALLIRDQQRSPDTALASVAQLVGASPHKWKSQEFNSWSGQMPGLWVWSPVGAHSRGN